MLSSALARSKANPSREQLGKTTREANEEGAAEETLRELGGPSCVVPILNEELTCDTGDTGRLATNSRVDPAFFGCQAKFVFD